MVNADKFLNQQKFLINSLCTYDNNVWNFPSFPDADIILPMLIQFAIMNSDELKNDVYYYKLQQLTTHLGQDSTLIEIYQDMWVPLFDHCCTVADELRKEVITLSNLCELFGRTESADSEKTIENLLSAVEKCNSPFAGDIGSLADFCLEHKVFDINRLEIAIKSDISPGCKLFDISKVAITIKTKPFDKKWLKEIGKKITKWSNVQALSNEADQLKETLEVFGLDGSLVSSFTKEVHPYL